MKKLFNYIITGSLLAVISSCDLDVEDPASLPPSVALDKIAGIQGTVNSFYRRVNEFNYYGQQTNIHPEALADNVQIVNRTGRYEQEIVNAVGTFMNRWAGRYQAINETNWVIAKADDATDGTQAQKNLAKGEAYFIRALEYFELLRVYGYEPGKEVNGFNLGVILRTTPTEGASNADLRSRSTNLEGYQQIEADLLQALILLPEPSGLTAGQFPYRASRLSARALLAKVYLYWGRYADAAIQADLALAYTEAPLRTAANWVAAFSASPHGESFFESEIRSSDWSGVDGPNNSMNSITTNMLSGSQYVVAASPELMAAFEAGDIRGTIYLNTAGTLNRPQCRKWPAEKGNFLENIPIIRRSDILLVAAEGKARSGNEPGALINLNTLRTNRGLAVSAAAGQALLDLILNERRVELAFEGHRWFDLKRLGLEITKPAIVGTPNVPYSDFRILQQIPQAEVLLNSNLQQNPGY